METDLLYVGLIDLDSILYTSVYKCVSISDMRSAINKYGKEDALEWLMEEVLDKAAVRAEDRISAIRQHLEDNFEHDVFTYEYYVTRCSKSFRKELTSNYKANRKRNKYVPLVRDYFINNQNAFHDEYYEADDLIADRAKEIDEYVIISIDKDLKQIGGWLWSPYIHPKDENRDFKQKKPVFITPEEGDRLFWIQMLEGDSADNIKGVKGIGKKKAEKLLSESDNLFIATARQYIAKGQKEDFWVNYQLMKLGTR